MGWPGLQRLVSFHEDRSGDAALGEGPWRWRWRPGSALRDQGCQGARGALVPEPLEGPADSASSSQIWAQPRKLPTTVGVLSHRARVQYGSVTRDPGSRYHFYVFKCKPHVTKAARLEAALQGCPVPGRVRPCETGLWLSRLCLGLC